MRIRVREDLPVQPRHARCGDLRSPVLDVRVARRRREYAAGGAVVVLRVVVARAPLLEH
jgi:hypothetical protein